MSAVLDESTSNIFTVTTKKTVAEVGLDVVLTGVSQVKVRDMIAHTDLPELSPPFELAASVAGQGTAAAFRLTPVA